MAEPASGLPDLVGAAAELRHHVSDTDTATALGSGDVPALATPRLLAWMEGATVAALADALGEGRTSVGTEARIQHRRATRVGRDVVIRAVVAEQDGRELRFEASAEHADDGTVAAHAQISRAVVERSGFLGRL